MKRFRIYLLMSLALVAAACNKEKVWEFEIPYPEEEHGGGGEQGEVLPPHRVEAQKNSTSTWGWYEAYTIDRIKGFVPYENPEVDEFGGWKVNVGNPDGFFRVRKIGDRWWMIDPNGNIYLSQGVAVFSPGSSDRQKANVKEKFGSQSNWAKQESTMLKENGFNSLGAWSDVSTVKGLAEPMPYTVIVNPMINYIGYLRKSGLEEDAFKGSKYWEKYPYDFPMVFDPAFDTYVTSALSSVGVYQNDKYCIGYFIDNEIPWKTDALQSCLKKWPSTHINHQKAQQWLDERKGKAGASYESATEDDKKAFIAYVLEVYLQKVTTALRSYDPNHLFLGCRFNQWGTNCELVNNEIFKVAGKYMDVISVNHYQKWQPDQEAMRNWEAWSGKPFMVTEFYTKGIDSGMLNSTGAGWLVRTQNDRGLFYENFVHELIKSKVCVGWHWFTYMDNDPENAGADDSNKDSNKGIVTWDCQRYDALLEHMTSINHCTYQLARFYSNTMTE